MINTNIATTDSFPSSIGMSVYGRALGAVVGVDVCPQTTAVVLAGRMSAMGRIKDVLEHKSDKILIINADEEAPYCAVMDTMDELRHAGIEDMGLITSQPQKAGE